MKRQTAIAKVLELYDNERANVRRLAESAVSCGAIDLDDYKDDEYVLPKIIATVIFSTMANGYCPTSATYRQEVKNLALHI